MLKKIWISTANLYERFGLSHTVDNGIKGMTEEINEVFDAMAKLGVDEDNLGKRQDLAQEAIDLLVTVMSALMAMNIQYAELEYAANAVIQKNDAKSHITHVVYNNKITRKDKVANHFEND